VVGLVAMGCVLSALTAAFMLMVTYPGDECMLFVSVRGEALIYGHPAGCRYISTAHILVLLGSLGFGLTLACCTRRQRSQPSVGSNRTLRGSMTAMSVDGLRSKPTISLIVISILITMLVGITTIVLISGYVVTCGEMQYETRRQIYRSQTLGTTLHNPIVTCFSIMRDADMHTRFRFDHYELSGSWHGQYTAYRHGRPHVWTGGHDHWIDLALGLELSLACSLICSILWIAITWILALHRRSVKARNRLHVAESIEDQKIWAADAATLSAQQAATLHQYELLSRQTVAPQSPNPYESLGGSVAGGPGPVPQAGPPPVPSSEASTVDTMMAHQSVIAHTHPNGSFFLTNNGTYVQLVNGVLTNVEVAPTPQVPVQYMQLQFPDQFGAPAHPVTSSPPGYGFTPQPQLQPPSQPYPQPHSEPPSQPSSLGLGGNPLTQPLMPQGRGHPQPRPNKTSPPPSDSSSEQPATADPPTNTRMNMRRQKDIAALAGIKCSQF